MPVIGDEITLGVANTNGVAVNAKIIAGNFRVIATKDSIMNEFGLLTSLHEPCYHSGHLAI